MSAVRLQRPAVGDLNRPLEMSPAQQQAMEMYAGNWMRDFSQFLVPAALNAISQAPRTPGQAGGGVIGAAGAEHVTIGLLQALASLEFGEDITRRLITGPNIGVYRPEEHMDNPAGMSFGGDVLVRGARGRLGAADYRDPRAHAQLAGSAVPGAQLENPALYGTSGAGLSQHIYNTTESVKRRFTRSVAAGPTPEGRMHFGTGLHGVEDYFSHSNFIEVALNVLLRDRQRQPRALRNLRSEQPGGTPVDTLYDVNVNVGGRSRQAVTTGTFTTRDTAVSIAHVLLPRLPGLFTAVDRALDRLLLALESGPSGWAAIKRQLQSDRAGAALVHLLEGMDQAGMQLPVATVEKWRVPDLPDFLPDRIEHGLEGRWIATGLNTSHMAPSGAIPAYQDFYHDLKQIFAVKDQVLGLLDIVAPFLADAARAIEFLRKSFQEVVESVRQAIRQKVRESMFELIERLTGINVPGEKRKQLADWMEAIHHGVETLTHSTSLEEQEHEGAFDQLSPEERRRRLPAGALPPSHSEISKDHPAHAEHAAEEAGDSPHGPPIHGPSTESVFFDVHRALAIESVRHLAHLLEQAWRERGEREGLTGGALPGLDAREAERRNREAREAGQRGARLAEREGRRFAQADPSLVAEARPLLDAVDLYIGHPEDSNWWRPIVQAIIDRNAEEVLHIEARNLTRRLRGRPPSVRDALEALIPRR